MTETSIVLYTVQHNIIVSLGHPDMGNHSFFKYDVQRSDFNKIITRCFWNIYNNLKWLVFVFIAFFVYFRLHDCLEYAFYNEKIREPCPSRVSQSKCK